MESLVVLLLVFLFAKINDRNANMPHEFRNEDRINMVCLNMDECDSRSYFGFNKFIT